jgi:hypothetical protein
MNTIYIVYQSRNNIIKNTFIIIHFYIIYNIIKTNLDVTLNLNLQQA